MQLTWRKSTYSSDPDLACCVQVGIDGRGVVRAIGDSQDPDGPVLPVDGAAWRSLIGAVKALP